MRDRTKEREREVETERERGRDREKREVEVERERGRRKADISTDRPAEKMLKDVLVNNSGRIVISFGQITLQTFD